ncbi:hypothetical protein GA0061098_104919 [Bradyrhizobium shewense]|uniref:Uncharacterized protein n=1 Tax=Bradyrhizobium shewense TaxID=1761772 RepID=A0A1C3XTQ8_9BRAD|nr:hypothetical protein [Bradyrhizobium shewense]SCB55677.1 hypothetical protein GA0061098_104919 [Bradyrhizobium shewense]
MDARLVWDTWRRVLTDDRLANWVMDSNSRTEDALGCTADELAILVDYAGTPAPTESNIGMYRRGLVRNALGALDLVPLTRRLLHASGLDVEAVASEFVQSGGYADNGPYFWRTAACFVAFLAGRAEFFSPRHQDVLAIDAAGVALARRLGEAAPLIWPNTVAEAFSAESPSRNLQSSRFVAHPAATMISSSYDLTPWIENPFDFDAGQDLEASSRHWLIYVPAAEAAHEYAELSHRAACLFDVLRVPKSLVELSTALNDVPQADVLALIDSLAGLGVIVSGSDLLDVTPREMQLPHEEGTHAVGDLPLASHRICGGAPHETA